MSLLRSLFPAPPLSVYCDKASKSARRAFSREQFKLVSSPEDARLLWIRKGYREYFSQLGENQLLNHIPSQGALSDKGNLTANLRAHDKTLDADAPLRMADFYQDSYRLYDPADRKRFLAKLPPTDRPENLWILKPTRLSKGRGIEILWKMDSLRKDLRKAGNKVLTDKPDQVIAQRYIRKPLLLEGRKSEFRVYWLVANLDPLLVLMNPVGQVRLNSLPYQLDDFDNQLVHVTNVFQQKSHPDFDPTVTLKWSFQNMEDYIVNDLGLAEPGFLSNTLLPRVKRMLEFVARAARDALKPDYPSTGHCFGLYGADIIMDENLNPFLTEVQKGPGLSFSDPVKQDVIPPMLAETARIMCEVQKRRQSGESLHDLKSVEHFQWVINDAQSVALSA